MNYDQQQQQQQQHEKPPTTMRRRQRSRETLSRRGKDPRRSKEKLSKSVGEMPGPNERRRAASRDELNRPLESHTKRVLRSVSVLAPWKPRDYREPFEMNYDQQQHEKPPTTMRRRQRSRETLSRRGKDPRRSKETSRKAVSVETCRYPKEPKGCSRVT